MKRFDSIPRRTILYALATFAFASTTFAGTNVVVWDTMKGGPGSWKKVPSNLMELEKDPLKSASDPGYYGREYTFTGDVVIINPTIRAYFRRNSDRVLLIRPKSSSSEQPSTDATDVEAALKNPSICYGDIVVGATNRVTGFELIRNAGDEVVLRVDYGKGDTVTYSFGKNEIIEVKPAGSLRRVQLNLESKYVIVPGFVGDDLIFGAQDAPSETLTIPADNMLVNLLFTENAAAVITWPGKHKVTVTKRSDYFSSTEIETSGDPVFIAALAAPGIWHREKLNADFLEKDVTIGWKPPFMAQWQTQLTEGSVKTTYAFRHAKGTVWRGVPGSYNYPTWFDSENANFSLSKKVPPKGEAIIYFLEGDDTPASILAPADVLKATLGRPMAESILDVEGRKLRTHHGAAGSNVHRACTCGYTEAIQAVFEKGEECDQKQFVNQSINDMIYFVRRHLERIDEYRAFATNLTEYLQATSKSNPKLKEYLDDLEQTVQQIPAEYENQKENMKSLAYAAELEEKTMALTGKKDSQNLKQYMELLKMWRGMGGAQDYVVAQYHMIARRLFQDAGYNVASISNPKAVEVAQEIRARIKQVLRNPDGYEIWANY